MSAVARCLVDADIIPNLAKFEVKSRKYSKCICTYVANLVDRTNCGLCLRRFFLSGVIVGESVIHDTCHSCQIWFTIQRSRNNGIVYSYMHGPHCVTSSSPVGDTAFKFGQKNRMTSQHVRGVVRGEAVTRGIFHTSSTWSMHYTRLL